MKTNGAEKKGFEMNEWWWFCIHDHYDDELLLLLVVVYFYIQIVSIINQSISLSPATIMKKYPFIFFVNNMNDDVKKSNKKIERNQKKQQQIDN